MTRKKSSPRTGDSLRARAEKLLAAEEALRAANLHWQTTFDAINDGVCILDREDRIVQANRCFLDFVGKTASEAVGRFCWEVVHGTQEPIAGCPKVRMHESRRRETLELAVADRWLQVAVDPIMNEAGDLTGAVHILTDITERKQAEAALRDRESHYRSLFEDSPISLWEEDFSAVKQYLEDLRAQGIEDFRGFFNNNLEELVRCAGLVKIVAVNEATLSLYQADSQTDFLACLPRVFSEPSYDIFREELIALAEGKTHFKADATNNTLQGEEKHIYISMSVPSGYEDTWSKVLVSIIDITERKRAEEALKQIEWMLSKKLPLSVVEEHRDVTEDQGYGDLTELNRAGIIRKSIGPDILRDIVDDYLNLLGTSAAVYEKNGDYAFGIFSSKWCQFMDRASRKLCDTDDNAVALSSGKWLCHESCWTCASEAMATGAPVDIECHAGIRLYAIPIFAGDEVIGSINFGYGDPPRDPVKVREIAELYKLDYAECLREANSYNSRPGFIIDLAKKRLQASARLIGASVERTQTEEALRETEDKFRAIFDNAKDGILLADAEISQFVFANQKICEMLGYGVEEMHNLGVKDIHPRESLPYVMEQLKRLLSGESLLVQEIPMQRKDGSVFYAEVNAIPMMLAGKRGVLGIFRDITERKQSEEALARSEMKYRTLLENLPQRVFLKDRNSTYISCNDHYARDLMIRPEDVAGTTDYDFYPRELAEKYRDYDKRIIESGSAEELDDKYIRGGQEMMVRILKTPVRDKTGQITGILGIFWDITEQKQLENRLALQAQLDHIFATEPDTMKLNHSILKIALKATGSALGYFGYINARGDLVSPSLSREVREQCRMEDKPVSFPKERWAGLWGESLLNKKITFANEPLKPPPGHVPLHRVVCVPILHRDELIGQIAVANKATDYLPQDLEILEHLAQSLASPLVYRRDRKRLQKALKRSNQELQAANVELVKTTDMLQTINELTSILHSVHDVEALVKLLLAKMKQVMPAKVISLTLVNFLGRHQVYTLTTDREGQTGKLASKTFPLEKKLAMESAQLTQRPFIQEDATSSPAQLPEDLAALKLGVRSYIQMPLISGSELKGVLSLGSELPGQYQELHQEFLQRLSNHLVLVLDRISYLEEVQKQSAELKELNQLILEQSEQIYSAYHIVTELSKALNLDEIVKTILPFLQRYVSLERHVLALLDDAGGVRVVNMGGIPPEQEDYLTSCLKSDEKLYAMVSSGLRLTKGDYSEAPDCLNVFFENWVIWPFKGKQRSLGFLLLDDPGAGARDTLAIILNQAAVFMENILLYKNMAAVNQQLTQANLRLTALDQQKTDFLNTVAHDVRTPLTSIRSYADLLLMYPDESKETQKEFLAIISRESVRLGGLINDYLDLTRIESGIMKYEDQAFDVIEYINHILSVYQGEANHRGIALTAVIEPGLPEVFADPARIAQVLANLLSNAVKFTPDRGRIKVTARESVEFIEEQRRPVLEVAVTDTGPGIDPQHHNMVFEKFLQVEDSVTKAKAGTGLGLSIAKNIIAHYGGRIWVESELGQGARFVFTLPVTR